ncbi:MAG: thiol reductant ABC exporter subunit CydC [Anaerolineae bacterium]|nr:thiol reductant ABC exporter subunit CydC [Anaerolineae bacterium]
MKILRFLLSLVKPFIGLAFLSVFLGAATITANISLMGTSAYLIAYAALHPSIAYLQVAIVGVRFFGLARGAFRYLERLVSHSLNFKILARLRVWLFARLEAIAPAGLLDASGGDLLTRLIEDVETLDNFYIRALSPPLVAVVVVGSTSLFLGGFSPILGWTMFAGLLVSGLCMPIMVYFGNRTLGRDVVKLKSQMGSLMVESMQGLGELSIYGRNGDALTRLNGLSNQLADKQFWQTSISSAGNAINLLVTNITLWGMLIISISLVNQGELDGVLLAVIALITLASFEAVTPLVQSAQNLENSMTSARRIFDTAEKKSLINDGNETMPDEIKTISVQNLSFGYGRGNEFNLSRINLNLHKGKKLALVGPSGAGKTSMAGLLLRFYPVTSGKILLDDNDIQKYSADKVRERINLVSQSVYIFNDTLRNNLLLARPDANDEFLVSVLKQVSLIDWFNALPQGLNTWMGEQGAFISGGERQRLALARTLLMDSPFIILDEPFSNLDSVTSQALFKTYLQALNNKGIMWITHRLVGLEEMDEIIVINNGRITERGQHQALIQQNGWYARMWVIQNQLI